MEDFFENIRDADISKLKFKVVKVFTIIGAIFGVVVGGAGVADGHGLFGFLYGIFIITLLAYLLPFLPDGIKKWYSFFANGCLIGVFNFFLFPYIIPALTLYYAVKGFMAIKNKNFNHSDSYFDSALSDLSFDFGSSSRYYGSSSSSSGYSSSSGSGRLSPLEGASIITALYTAGESCNTCRHNNDRYGDCPYEDIRGSHPKPNVQGVEICHKHSNAWNYR